MVHIKLSFYNIHIELTHPPVRSNACPVDTRRCPAAQFNIIVSFLLLLLIVKYDTHWCVIEHLILVVKSVTVFTWPGIETSVLQMRFMSIAAQLLELMQLWRKE